MSIPPSSDFRESARHVWLEMGEAFVGASSQVNRPLSVRLAPAPRGVHWPTQGYPRSRWRRLDRTGVRMQLSAVVAQCSARPG